VKVIVEVGEGDRGVKVSVGEAGVGMERGVAVITISHAEEIMRDVNRITNRVHVRRRFIVDETLLVK